MRSYYKAIFKKNYILLSTYYCIKFLSLSYLLCFEWYNIHFYCQITKQNKFPIDNYNLIKIEFCTSTNITYNVIKLQVFKGFISKVECCVAQGYPQNVNPVFC